MKRYRTTISSRSKRRRLAFQALCDRRVLAAIAVTTTADVVDDTDGEVSLREAIETANATTEADEITKSASVTGLAETIRTAP